jgi:hypothetical protein
MRPIETVIEEYGSSIKAIDGVLDVSLGMHLGKQCIFVHVKEKKEELKKAVSSHIEGHPIHFVVEGTPDIF